MMQLIGRHVSLHVGLVRQSDSGGDGGGGDTSGEDVAKATEGLSAGDWITAGIIVAASIVAAIVVSQIVRKLVSRRNEMIASLLGRVAGFIVFLIGFVYGLSSIGVAVGPLIGGLGIGGLAIGFALKGILENLIAGVLIQLRQPFQVGDLVDLDGHFGKIEEVTLRTVDMQTVDGEYVLIPASSVINNAIVNWSTLGRRREEVIIGIDYSADPLQAAAGIKQAVGDLDVILNDKEVKVVITEFGDSSVNLRILAWHDVDDHFLEVTHQIAGAAKQWCEENDVGIPFPIRSVELSNLDELAQALQRSRSDDPIETDEQTDEPADEPTGETPDDDPDAGIPRSVSPAVALDDDI